MSIPEHNTIYKASYATSMKILTHYGSIFYKYRDDAFLYNFTRKADSITFPLLMYGTCVHR